MRIKLACIFTNILGGRTFSSKLLTTLESDPRLETAIQYVDYDDYKEFRAPRALQISNALESAFVTKKKFLSSRISNEKADAFAFQGYQLTLFFRRIIKTTPTILALDETPTTARLANKAWKTEASTGLIGFMASTLAQILDLFFFKPIFRDISFFLARTEKVKNSLIDHYNIPSERIEVTYMPISIPPPPALMQIKEKPKVLFIGGEFERKGGAFLFDIFNDELYKEFELTIVSNDPKFDIFQSNENVTIIKSLSHENIIDLMLLSDVLMFPSYRDALGLVICEALACGLAVLTRDCGAQKELVQNGVNGVVFDYDSTPQQWRGELSKIASDPSVLSAWKMGSRNIYKKLLSPEVFQAKVSKGIERIIMERGKATW